MLAAWIGRGVRVHALETERVVCDDRYLSQAFGRTDASARSLVTVVLSGRAFVSVGGHVHLVRAGEALFMPHKSALAVRTEGARYASVVLEWDPELGGGSRTDAVVHGPVAHEPLEALAKRIREDDPPETSILASALAALDAAGVPLPQAHAWTSLDMARAQEVADALDAVLSSLDAQPMASDLEARLGVGPRQVTRLIDGFRTHYGYGATNWQQTRGRRRLMLAAVLLTAPGAKVADVAAEVGYRRPETMTRAFANVGFGPPRRVALDVEALGEAWRREAERSAALAHASS